MIKIMTVAVAFDIKSKIENPSQNSVLNMINEIGPKEAPGFIFDTVKGVDGQFYHGNDIDRKKDIKWACQEILKKRGVEE